MTLALTLGRRGLGQTWPNPAVGAVVVRHGQAGPVVVGRGWTAPGGRPHAETEALKHAGAAAAGATLYVTLEPCSHHGKTPPCADAIVTAGITRVVSALEDPNPEVAGEGHARLRAAGIAVDIGVGAEEARRAHDGHTRRMRDGRPHILLKLAVSSDGKAGLAGRQPADITGRAARQRAHMLRAASDAMLIGIGTALADNPLLTCRLPGMAGRSPVRVVLDRSLRLPLGSRLVTTAGTSPLWVVGSEAASREREVALRAAGAEVLRVEEAADRLELAAVLCALVTRGITRLMVEGGPIVAAAFVAAGLMDEVALFRRAFPIGPDGIDALEGLPLTAVTQAPHLRSRGVEPVGEDTLEMFERCLPGS
jgi:diaminohydroxyphosphoribosylaminopyrimidine deaminase/5-amino-6-(5-phosphoribosylamino)uracil reductase